MAGRLHWPCAAIPSEVEEFLPQSVLIFILGFLGRVASVFFFEMRGFSLVDLGDGMCRYCNKRLFPADRSNPGFQCGLVGELHLIERVFINRHGGIPWARQRLGKAGGLRRYRRPPFLRHQSNRARIFAYGCRTSVTAGRDVRPTQPWTEALIRKTPRSRIPVTPLSKHGLAAGQGRAAQAIQALPARGPTGWAQ